MGLRRKAVHELYAWHAQRDSRALLVTGARQVGKTYLVEEFIRDYYEHVIKFDLVEQPHVLKAFDAANNVDELYMAITAFAGTSLVPGKTVIFIDGIQECAEAFTAIKYLVKHEEYDFVLSGSLLEVELRNVRSLPVGSLRIVNMYPLDFEEFCWANGVEPEALDYVRECFSHRKPVLSAVHDRLLTLFHHYLMVGGIPAAVQELVSTQNLQEARSIQEGILNLYRRDIAQYAPADDRPAIQEIFDQVPTQLDSQGKRFTFASIAPRGTYERYKNQVLWLVEAHVVLPVPSVTEPNHPLTLQESRSYFKLFMGDVGLLTCSYGLEALQSILCGDLDTSCGSLFENAVAQELVAHGHDLHYFRSKGIGEVDFVFERGGGTVQLAQVKSGKSYKRHSALTKLLAREDHAIDSAVVLCEDNLSVVDKVVYCPVYMAMCL